MRMKSWTLPLLLLSVITMVAGCSKSGNSPVGTQVAATEPVTLTLYVDAVINDDEINKFIVQPVQKKTPNISFNIIKNGKGTEPQTLVAAGTVPDLIYTTYTAIGMWRQLGVLEDLNALVKKYHMDLSRFDPNLINVIQAFSGGNGQLYAIPIMQNMQAMFYNKDLFDKFGVAYPKDLMSWDDVITLARQLTRSDAGTKYIGLIPNNLGRTGQGLSLPYVNPNTLKATVNNDDWKKVYTLEKEIFDIPGYIGENNQYSYNLNTDFFKNGNVAMAVGYVPDAISKVDWKAVNFDWDMVSLPNFQEAVGTGLVGGPFIMMVNQSSKYTDAAFQAISVVSSDEVQLQMSQDGKLSALSNVNVQQKYAQNVPIFNGKNVAGIFKAKPRKMNVPTTEYDTVVRAAIDASLKDLAAGKDINTLLRETEDNANKAIQAQVAQK
ncbi:MAG: hypothetical protein JWN30_1039 [Bacilli bacterium]|nr:hypothetical protein [Bacilli bacterium]